MADSNLRRESYLATTAPLDSIKRQHVADDEVAEEEENGNIVGQQKLLSHQMPWNDPNASVPDPLLRLPPSIVREGDFVILDFVDGKQIFAQCVKSWKGKSPPVKINKRCYPTANLVGLPYGTVLELGVNQLLPLPEGEDLLPNHPSTTSLRSSPVPPSSTAGMAGGGAMIMIEGGGGSSSADFDSNTNNADGDADADIDDDDEDVDFTDSTFPSLLDQVKDNRNLIDNRTNQSMDHDDLARLRQSGADGSTIVAKLIENSSSFSSKTDFSKAKYIERKQKKYQPRCRMVQCTPATICRALFHKEPRKLMNLREDTLGQILSYSNASAGCQVLVMETCMGVITGALAQRMGGYGKILSVYTGQQPSCLESLERFNLSFAEYHSIKWIHSGDVFDSTLSTTNHHHIYQNPMASGVLATTTTPANRTTTNTLSTNCNIDDPEKVERERLQWPCPLQDHTRVYLQNMATEQERNEFLAKRCARFCRKLTRHTPLEAKEWLQSRPCDSLILVARYDPTATLLGMLPYLAPSCPFVVYSEFIEPLTECFREIQKQELAINLRLSDTWMRGYQVLPGRTHPHMCMSQSGGFLLTGIKLCPETGHNELDETVRAQIRAQIGGRRGRRPKNKNHNNNTHDNDDDDDTNKPPPASSSATPKQGLISGNVHVVSTNPARGRKTTATSPTNNNTTGREASKRARLK